MDYDDQNVQQLRRLASSRKISGRAEMNREELIAALIVADEKNQFALLKQKVAELESRIARIEGRTMVIGG